MKITRRQFIFGSGSLALPVIHAAVVEPLFQLETTVYSVKTPRWPRQASVRIAVLSDLHVHEPYLTARHLAEVVERTNALKPDVTVLLGDYLGGPRLIGRGLPVSVADWSAALKRLWAPLGVYSILGNHDWWRYLEEVRIGMRRADIPILENGGRRLRTKDVFFWLLGLGDQMAFPTGNGTYVGVDDLASTLAMANDSNPRVLLAHEPLIFPRVPTGVDLVLAGHTHGGQVRLPLLGRPGIFQPELRKYAYGYFGNQNSQMIVTSGIGMSILPIRFLVPPEIVIVELSGETCEDGLAPGRRVSA